MLQETELLAEDLADLRQRYLRLLIAIGAALAWLFGMRFFSYNTAWERTWPVVGIVLAGSALGYRLRRNHLTLAATCQSLLLAAALLVETWLVGSQPAMAFFPALVVLIAAVSTPIAVATASFGVAGAFALAYLGHDIEVGPPWLVLVLTAAAVAVSSRQFLTTFAWARSAAHRAEAAARDAQKRREEVMATNRALRNAYYLVERTNHALAQAQAELVEARRLKTEFVNTVSHELRAPLNYVVGFSELMVNSPSVYGEAPWPEGLREDLQEIFNSSSHLSRLIDDILDLAQINAHRMVLNREHANLADVAHEAVAIVRPWQERKGLRLIEECDGELPHLLLDRTRVRQIILNLLNNAVRFTERGTITLRVQRQGSQAVVSVADTGPGIPDEQLPRVFQEFVQLDMGQGRPLGGSGLGLAICRRFVEMHGGQIWAKSTVGAGSTFFVSLPFTPPVATTRTDADSLSASYWQVLQKQGPGKDILLLVGGSDVLLQLQHDMPDYELAQVSQESVASSLEQLRPRAIVVDRREADVQSVAEAIDSSPHDVPIVALSLRSLTDRGLEGTKAHLVKPVTRARLLETLARVCPAAENVLVVDDDPRMRHFLAATLESSGKGYRVESLASPTEAIRRMREGAAHVLLLDLRLPEVDGTSVLQVLREDELLSKIPVITISAYLDPSEELAQQREVISLSCKRRLGRQQLLAVLKATLEETAPRFQWEGLGSAPAEAVGE